MKVKTKNLNLDAFIWDETADTLTAIEDAGVVVTTFTDLRPKPDYRGKLEILTVNGRGKPVKGDYIVKYETGEVDIVKQDEYDVLFEVDNA